MESVESSLPSDYSSRDASSYLALEGAEDSLLGGSSFETDTDEAAAFIANDLLTSIETSSDEECAFCDEDQESPVPWASLFALQTEVFVLFLLKSVISSLHSLHSASQGSWMENSFFPVSWFREHVSVGVCISQ